ncbi:porin [Psychromonas sp. PT13]|uniref:porin n=1 Tax=Psychromonas sp. PT13 TaxID=3439547 RepID=UPI003EB6D1CD
MKKAILPAVISAALLATSAHAANLYDADGTSVALSGEVDGLYYAADDGSSTANSISSWANAQLDISTKISDSTTGMASFEIEATDGSEVKVDDAWVGISGDFGTFKLGETGSSYGILEKAELANEGNDIDLGDDNAGLAYADGEGSGNSIRYQKTVGAVALSANYFIDDSADIEGFAVSADYSADAFSIGAGYIDSGDDVTGLGVSASYEADALFLAATYSINSQDDDSDNDFDTYAVSASYAFEPASLYGSYQVNDGDNVDITNWYVGVSKDITANIYAFVEYNDQDSDTSLLSAGIYYSF